jgi:hypothetical protein
MAWSFAYIGLRRVLELLGLLTARTGRRRSKSWCSGTRSPCYAARSPGPSSNQRWVLLAALSRLLPRRWWQAFFIHPFHTAAMAP